MQSGSSNSKLPVKYQILKKMMPIWDRFSPMVSARIARTAFLKPIKFPIPPEEVTLRNKAQEFRFISNKKNIQAYCWNPQGTEGKIICMHGWASRGTHLKSLIEIGTKRNFVVYAIDAPGHGLSDGKLSDVVQFAQAILDLELQVGKFDVGIGHSMGGTALLYAMSRGLHLHHVCMLATPSLESEILDVYLRKMNVSMRTGNRMLQLLEQQFGAPFEKYTALYLAQSLVFKSLHLVYDLNDKEVSVLNGEALKKVVENATLTVVKSTGHAKMLSDDELAKNIIDHIKIVPNNPVAQNIQ